MKYTIIVHGGAWDIPAEYHEAHKNGVEKALELIKIYEDLDLNA